MPTIQFKDYIFSKFIEWEKQQPKRRSSFSAYARWLSNNSLNIEIKHQVLDYWINGKIPKEDKYIFVLAEKLGEEVYEILNRKPISYRLLKINSLWEFIPEDTQIEIEKIAEKYETQNELHRIQRPSKPGKVTKPK